MRLVYRMQRNAALTWVKNQYLYVNNQKKIHLSRKFVWLGWILKCRIESSSWTVVFHDLTHRRKRQRILRQLEKRAAFHIKFQEGGVVRDNSCYG